MSEICIICREDNNLVEYNHGCGIYHIHEACLYKWNVINKNKCVTCSGKIDDINKVINNNQTVINIPNNIIVPENQNMIAYKKKLCCKRAVCGLLLVLIPTIILFGILSPLMVHLFF